MNERSQRKSLIPHRFKQISTDKQHKQLVEFEITIRKPNQANGYIRIRYIKVQLLKEIIRKYNYYKK